MKLDDCIVYQNFDVNAFVAAQPGAILIGNISRQSAKTYAFEKPAVIKKSFLLQFADILETIAKYLAGKKGTGGKTVDKAELYDLDEKSRLLQRRESLAYIEDENVVWQYNFSRPRQFQDFCAALFAVVYAILLPQDDYYAGLLEVNISLRECISGLDLPKDKVKTHPALRQFPIQIRHYLRSNVDIILFAYKISLLGNTK